MKQNFIFEDWRTEESFKYIYILNLVLIRKNYSDLKQAGWKPVKT